MAVSFGEKKITPFPSQKKPFSQKSENWGKQNIDAAIDIARGDYSRIRKSADEKQMNYDIANGRLQEEDFENAFNPLGLKGVNFPAKAQDYPIESPYFGVLKGEEINRYFNWRVRLLNPDAISQREEELAEQLRGIFMEQIAGNSKSLEEVRRKLEEFKKYQDYEYQDYREKAADRALNYGYYTQRMKQKFSSGFYDVLVVGEEQYAVDEIMEEPEVSKINPIYYTSMGQGDSPYSEDADIHVIDYWKPVGKVIDAFWDELTSTEIDNLEKGYTQDKAYEYTIHGGQSQEDSNQEILNPAQIIKPDASENLAYGHMDTYGNVRVTHVIWRSRRKIHKLTYYDDEGEQQETFVDENYKSDESKGEEIESYWINEYWHGYKIGEDMYKKVEPLPRIGTRMNNPSVCKPPIVGTIYTYNNQKPISLMDRAKPYKYLYDIYMRRAELASARDKGVLAEMDLAKVPDGWDPELWMMYAEMHGFYVTDSFKQSNKGKAKGQILANLVQRGNETMNMSNAESIKTNLEMAQYIKQDLSEVLGVPPQRLGQVGNRETSGGVDQSITKSAHITEEWFDIHDDTKLRVMELYLETAKHAWANYTGDNPKVLDYIDDGLIRYTYKIDGHQFSMNDYGLYLDSSVDTEEMLRSVEQYAHAAVQNDKMSFSALFDIMRDHSLNSKIKKAEQAEEEMHRRQKELAQIQNRPKQQENQLDAAELKQKERQHKRDWWLDKYKADLEYEKGQIDADNDGIKDSIELDREQMKQQFEIQKQRMELDFKEKELQIEDERERDKLRQEKELALKELKKKYNQEDNKKSE